MCMELSIRVKLKEMIKAWCFYILWMEQCIHECMTGQMDLWTRLVTYRGVVKTQQGRHDTREWMMGLLHQASYVGSLQTKGPVSGDQGYFQGCKAHPKES